MIASAISIASLCVVAPIFIAIFKQSSFSSSLFIAFSPFFGIRYTLRAEKPQTWHFKQSISLPGPPADIVTIVSGLPGKSGVPPIHVCWIALPSCIFVLHFGQIICSRRTLSSCASECLWTRMLRCWLCSVSIVLSMLLQSLLFQECNPFSLLMSYLLVLSKVYFTYSHIYSLKDWGRVTSPAPYHIDLGISQIARLGSFYGHPECPILVLLLLQHIHLPMAMLQEFVQVLSGIPAFPHRLCLRFWFFGPDIPVPAIFCFNVASGPDVDVTTASGRSHFTSHSTSSLLGSYSLRIVRLRKIPLPNSCPLRFCCALNDRGSCTCSKSWGFESNLRTVRYPRLSFALPSRFPVSGRVAVRVNALYLLLHVQIIPFPDLNWRWWPCLHLSWPDLYRRPVALLASVWMPECQVYGCFFT